PVMKVTCWAEAEGASPSESAAPSARPNPRTAAARLDVECFMWSPCTLSACAPWRARPLEPRRYPCFFPRTIPRITRPGRLSLAGEGILERGGPVEHRTVGTVLVLVRDEVALALELQAVLGLGLGD